MKQAYLEELKAVESEINHMKQDMEEWYALRLEDEQVAEGQLDKYNSLSSSADSLFEKIAASTKIVKNAIVSGLKHCTCSKLFRGIRVSKEHSNTCYHYIAIHTCTFLGAYHWPRNPISISHLRASGLRRLRRPKQRPRQRPCNRKGRLRQWRLSEAVVDETSFGVGQLPDSSLRIYWLGGLTH